MLYYHSYHIKSINIRSRYQGNVLWVLIKQSSKTGHFFYKGTQSELRRKKAKLSYKSGYQIFFMPGSFGFKHAENCNIALRSMHMQPENVS